MRTGVRKVVHELTTVKRTLLTGLAVALMLPVGLSALASHLPPGGTFTDDDGSVHERGIEAIASTGITVGCNPPFDDLFCPTRELTRAELATLLSRALSLPPSSTDHFIDDNGHTLEGGINRIADAGITAGCNPPVNDRFCPNRVVTRAEAAAFLARALRLSPSSTDHFIDDNGHILEGAINRIADAGITAGCNPPANDRFCPDRRLIRAEMATLITRAFKLPGELPTARPPLAWQTVVTGLNAPIHTLSPPGEDRLLVAEQGGRIKVVENGVVRGQLFLNMTSLVVTGGERGLLSMTLHPDYPSDRRLFVWHSGPLRSGGTGNHTTYLRSFTIAPDLETVVSGSGAVLLAVDQPFSNHNGGLVGFGPDGHLYLGLGDGGSANDPGARARNLSTLLGKMIRINVDGAPPYTVPASNPYVGKAGRDEIWASGLRNPWRWAFDGEGLFIADVGQNSLEEVNLVPAGQAGVDYGWSRYEGTICNPNDTDPSCATAGLTFPVVTYPRTAGRSITGGLVYEGDRVRSLTHYYLYADFITGLVRGFRFVNGVPVEAKNLTGVLGDSGIVHFGLDSEGEVLVVDLTAGAIRRLVGG